jgi:hypothetical protein
LAPFIMVLVLEEMDMKIEALSGRLESVLAEKLF